MEYEEFKYRLLERLQEHYGEDAEVGIQKVEKNNGVSYDGIQIRFNGEREEPTPMIHAEEAYQVYRETGWDMDACLRAVQKKLEEYQSILEIRSLAKRVTDWEQVKGRVFPMLIAAKENAEALQELVSVPLLDLSIIYMVRGKMRNGKEYSTKVTKTLLQRYGVSREELHEQALKNMENERYGFLKIGLTPESGCRMEPVSEPEGERDMYVLTNLERAYGAAGILHKKVVQAFTKGQDFYVLPSSIHETIFVPVSGGLDRWDLDKMVREVNRAEVKRKNSCQTTAIIMTEGPGNCGCARRSVMQTRERPERPVQIRLSSLIKKAESIEKIQGFQLFWGFPLFILAKKWF